MLLGMGNRRMQRQSFVPSATLRGIEALPVTVEVSVGSGLPGISIVGLGDSTVKEARLRIKSAIKASGFSLPASNIVINLSPSSIKKVGAGFDLPMAIGILASTGQISPELAKQHIYYGELSLDGSVHGTNGLFAIARMASLKDGSLVSGATSEDLSRLLGENHLVIKHLRDLKNKKFDHLRKKADHNNKSYENDYADIASQDMAKRALQIAAAGNHGLLMIGPPGSGKTMLASRIPTIMPDLDADEIVQSALVHSVAGLDIESILAGKRPFRSPHHSATSAGLVGGGNPTTPGEVSLAHNGVLFLDELNEFRSSKLQLLRQPMEEHKVVLARADGTYIFPANFMLVGASNPCPCGYLGDPEKICTCSEAQIRTYQNRIGGPLMDRFDMVIDVFRSDPKMVMKSGRGKSSAQLKEEVFVAQEFCSWRKAREQLIDKESTSDVGMPVSLPLHIGKDAKLINECAMSKDTQEYLENLARARKMSGRAIMKTLSVARTIADMRKSVEVERSDLDEAVIYRRQDL